MSHGRYLSVARSRLIHDVRCIGCHYHLRGLDPTGNCPECGVAIPQSIAARDRPGPFGDLISHLCSTFLLLPMCLLALFVAEWDRGLLLGGCALFLALARYFTVQNIQSTASLSRWPGLARAFVALRAVFVAEIVAATLLAVTAIYLLLTTTGPLELEQVVRQLSIPGTPWAIAALASVIPLVWFTFELATALRSRQWTAVIVGAATLATAAGVFMILLHLPQHWPFGRIAPSTTTNLMIAMLVTFAIAVLIVMIATVELESIANVEARNAAETLATRAASGDDASSRRAA